jgi:RNA polymerase sigma factor (sigma-70 family)
MTTDALIASPGADGPPGVSDGDVASFRSLRPRLFGIACRVLGRPADADDVVQDAWIRWQGTDRSQIRDATGFLVAATTRLALTAGQSAHARREISMGQRSVEPVDTGADPALEAERRQALELAVGTLLEKLCPTERAAYVLREAFGYRYREIAELLGLTEVNARQMVTRARRRLSGDQHRPVDPGEHRRLLDAFVAAAQTGPVTALEQLLAADAGAGGAAVRPARAA